MSDPILRDFWRVWGICLIAALVIGFGVVVQENSAKAARIEHLESSLRAWQLLGQQHARDEAQQQARIRECREMVDSLLGVAEDCMSTCGER